MHQSAAILCALLGAAAPAFTQARWKVQGDGAGAPLFLLRF